MGCAATALLATWGIWQIGTAPNPAAGGPPALPAPVIKASSIPHAARKHRAGLRRSVPIKIRIRKIGLRAGLGEVGLAANGKVETPPYENANRAMWYRLGPSPGEIGSSVILGHVDDKKSVAVFYYLTRIRPGDEIEVTRTDRRVAVFTVTSIEQFAKSDFPSVRVYGPSDAPELRLITCGGVYDHSTTRWRDNIIVFARMTSTHHE